MTELKCPNCGGKQFEELAGKQCCIFCGAEFMVEEASKRQPISGAEMQRRFDEIDRRYGIAPHFYINRETVGVKPHPISRIIQPGIAAKYWDAQQAIGRAFLPAIQGLVNLLGSTP